MDSYAAGATTTPLLEETIGRSFERTVATHAEREALVEIASGRRWTWRQLGRAVDEVARGLIAYGIEKGDRVGIWAPNSAEWTITQFTTATARCSSTSTRRTGPTSSPTPSTSPACGCYWR